MPCTCLSAPMAVCEQHPNPENFTPAVVKPATVPTPIQEQATPVKASAVPAVVGDVLTVKEFKDALPDKVKKTVNQELIDRVNATLAEPEFFEQYRDNLLSYTRVMSEGRFKIDNYISAIKYVSHKLQGLTNHEAYSRTFPEKILRFAKEGVASKDIASYTTAYNKSKLVMLLLEQTLVPFHILNQDLRQKALNTQAELMITAKSEKVQTDAANSVLTHTAPPAGKTLELDISIKDDGSIAALREATLALAAQQRQAILSGNLSAHDVASAPLTIEHPPQESVA